jgi:hypothetical protein
MGAMMRRAVHRLTTSCFVVMSMLFAQLALASYVCPDPGGAFAAAQAMSRTMAAGEPCSALDEARPALCGQHAQGIPQALDSAKPPVVSLPAVVQLLVLPSIEPEAAPLLRPALAAADTRPPPTALFLTTLRLRV